MNQTPDARLGVGFLGAGPATQAIHLPTLARLREHFEVRSVMDVDLPLARAVADGVGARAVDDPDEVLHDPTVEVVAICSPASLHAEQVIAAMEAGKRAVFCEKPLAVSVAEAEQIAAVSTRMSATLIVGAMHAHDPNWTSVVKAVEALDAPIHTVHVVAVLPPNARFENAATQLVRPSPAVEVRLENAEQRAELVHMGILGLATHDLPLARKLLGGADDLCVVDAVAVAPLGYRLIARAGSGVLLLDAIFTEQWESEWSLNAWSAEGHLELKFPPSYVQAGSLSASLVRPGGTTVYSPLVDNGYVGEWLAIRDALVHGAPDASELVDDLRFAVELAQQARTRILEGAR